MTDTMPAIEDDEAAAPRILAEVNPCLAYASFQNAVPVLKDLRLANPGEATISGARLELTAAPPFIRARSWAIDRLDPGAEIALSDRRVELDAAYLAGLNEAERGTATFRLVSGETLLAEAQVPVRLLARDEWGGAGDMAQLLPAFVMPNDPATAKLLRAAAERLAAHGHNAALDGYQSSDPRRAYMLAAALYSAAAGFGLHYAEPPASFEARGQKVRRPATMLAEGLATCLDTALLLAAGLEGAGLNAVVALVEGHAATGVWLVKRTLGLAVEPDPVEIRKALAARELVLFETTGVTRRPPVPFDQACRDGAALVAEDAPKRFVAAVDVARTRSGGIAPLASHEVAAPTDEMETSGDLPLPAMPDFGGMPGEPAEEKPTTPAGRIDRWQRKLLDLSLRNRLLNFGTRGGAVPFLCPDAAGMEDRLAAGHALRIVSIPEQNPLGERDPALYREARGEDIQRRFAEDALLRDELASTLNKDDLDARLTALYRQARSDLAEGGTNTLFVAVGFLRWRKKPGDERVYRAPLLLLPAKLERRSASSPFRLLHHEDEVRFNATLLQFLERDFDLKVPALAGELPSDEKGIDVARVLDAMRRAVRDTPGFEVVDEAALGTFSFAKYLMWKDLTERTDALRQNRVVRHLIDNPDVPFADAVPFRAEREIDRAYAPADIVTPLPADSSQIVATMAAAEGKDFVIIGPPGTGKSQTIANMIAQCLASRRTVLFVAEKTAALDVVYRRLREHGLGSRCLELHSSKADRRHVLAQLRSAWEHGGAAEPGDWVELNGRLKVKRDELNGYAEALHAEGPSGMTPYRALGLALRGENRHAPALAWPSKDAHDRAAFAELEDLAQALGRTFAAVGSTPALRLVDVSEWSSAWQDRLLAAAANARDAAEAVEGTSARLIRVLGLHPGETTRDDAIRLAEFAEALDGLDDEGARLAVRADFARLREAGGELGRLVADFAAEEARLSARYDRAELRRVPVEDIDRRWREASASFWPLSWFKRRSVAKLLGTYAREGAPDPSTDLPLIRGLQAKAAAIEASPLAAAGPLVAGLDTDTARLSLQLERAAHLRETAARLAGTPERFASLLAVIAPALDQPERGALGQAAREHREAHRRFAEAERQFTDASGGLGLTQAGETFADIRARLADLAAGRTQLRDWTSWCAIRRRAEVQGLQALVADLEAGAVAPNETVSAFRLGYARWWLPLAIDADKRLRDFRRFQHEHAIDDFRALDDLVRKAASARVHAAIAHDLPAPDAVVRKSELGLLRHQMELKRPSRSIREMIGAMPESFAKLAPCVLMSPLSIAQYLPPDQALFDVVIFDEASQITTWDAVGAVARGRQTVIVGDPKQLPPTNFFGRNEAEEEGEAPDHERDLESILDEARASGLPVHGLRWHYRSRHESLIAFSNHHYYDNRLITFPSPVTEDRAVSLRHVPEAVYDRGKSRTNKAEARAIASDIAARLRTWLDLPEAERPTLGVITFNSQQQALIQDLLDDERREDPRLEWFFDDERLEPVFVKNLENVQGDERDVILFSITFGKDAAGKLAMDFGALNRDGGERRLNVAVTRARRELMLFSSIKAEAIDLSRSKAAGVRDLKTFLDYADRGAVALPAADAGSLGGAESPFEEAVAEALKARGWRIVPQVGVSGFRVDMGVRHPDHAGAFVAGIECDGATYHRSATARDRDKVREQVLRGLGWTILRVWSTDWWFDPAGATDRLHAALDALVAQSRAKVAAQAPPAAEEEQSAG
ncbi:DUF4011 domain-containing protein [Antarcticirhabdus aurantiaca]|uniref:DUF4011 domain-containing protein n=1 Tax=Antarcticirhabdus aurantiaca TaxID=2606717 RepID=A0ACD4NHL7_9HYPH|nr:DUF4011 domain-containing protein [Antarcticirhabdus aurantiaca]WAJ26304.1 DUF4011 domain-containing protein [Jeongeuplla avenae]